MSVCLSRGIFLQFDFNYCCWVLLTLRFLPCSFRCVGLHRILKNKRMDRLTRPIKISSRQLNWKENNGSIVRVEPQNSGPERSDQKGGSPTDHMLDGCSFSLRCVVTRVLRGSLPSLASSGLSSGGCPFRLRVLRD